MITGGTDAEVFAFIEDPQGGGTGLRASVESYGYNTGYTYAVLEDLIDVFDPPDDKLVCSGITARSGPNPIHPRLPGVSAGSCGRSSWAA